MNTLTLFGTRLTMCLTKWTLNFEPLGPPAHDRRARFFKRSGNASLRVGPAGSSAARRHDRALAVENWHGAISLTSEHRTSTCGENHRGSTDMPETPLWDELTRSEQRLLIRLFGGGSVRNQNPADVEGLCRRGLVDDEQNLSVPGLLALTLAMRRQQTDALRRTGFAA
jgi:hypothetical protein